MINAIDIVISILVKEKNWSVIVRLVLDTMTEAETLYKTGAERKEYVMRIVEQTAVTLNYNYDEEAKQKVSALIDAVCRTAKIVNGGGYNAS